MPSGPSRSGLLIVHGNRLEDLSRLLLDHVAGNPLADLTPDVWVVQGQGMAAWLSAQAARHPSLGILAATRILQPAAALWELQRLVLGADRVPSELPLDEANLVWRLVDWLSRLPEQDPVYAPLRHHLSQAPDSLRLRRLVQLAAQLADVFDAYQTHRPDWLRDWAQCATHVRRSDGRPLPLPESHRWQAALWAELVQQARNQTHLTWVSRDQVFEAFLQRLRAPSDRQEQTPAHWPQRLILLGVSALPMEHIHALGALSQHLQVLVFALNPSAAYWGDAQRRAHGPSSDLAAEPGAHDHPLLAAWGQQARDFLHLVDEADPHTDPRREAFLDPVACAKVPGALHQLQADILGNRHPADRRASPYPVDDTLVFCKAHSPLREVQALHDQVLLWLADDPSLSPRDIAVMVSDLAVYEPLVRATWGAFAPGDARLVPFEMTRPHPEQAHLLDTLQAGLDLLMGPAPLGDVLGWLEHPAVRRRFGLEASDLHTLSDWLHESGVRWGLDAEHAQRKGWPDALTTHNTHHWLHGLDRLLVSHALAGEAWHGLLSLPRVGGVAAECLNGLVRVLDALRTHEAAMREPMTPAQWAPVLLDWLTACHEPGSESQEAVLVQVRHALEDWGRRCETAACQVKLPLSVVAQQAFESVRAAQTGARGFGSGVVFTTAMPMQSVPFRRICLLGLNDGLFPRQRTRRDFDLMDERGWGRPGDRSRHDDDRYLLLQAVLSARDGVYVSWQGFQMQDSKPLPASVLVNQWLDVLRQAAGQPWPVRTLPLQAHGLAYFEERPGDAHPWRTHALEWQAARWPAPSESQTAESGSPLSSAGASPSQRPAAPPAELSLRALQGWLRHPIDAFVRERLGIQWPDPPEAWPDAEPFELPVLAQHHWVQSGARLSQLPSAWRLNSDWPAGSRGDALWLAIEAQAQDLHARWLDLTQNWTASAPDWSIDLELLPWRVHGRDDHLHRWQDSQGYIHHTSLTASRLLDPKIHRHTSSHEGSLDKALRPRLPQILRTGVTHVLACAQGLAPHTHLIGPDATVDWPAMASDQAQSTVRQWLTLYRTAWQQPMPVLCDLAGTWLTLRLSPANGSADRDNRARQQVRQRADVNSRHVAWDLQRHAVVQRFLPDAQSALTAIENWASALYQPLLEGLHLQVAGGERHHWMTRPAGSPGDSKAQASP